MPLLYPIKCAKVGLETARILINGALEAEPGHPRLLAARAWNHVMRAIFGYCPHEELDAAEYLLKEVEARRVSVWPVLLTAGEARKPKWSRFTR